MPYCMPIRERIARMKRIIVILFVVTIIAFGGSRSFASWLIDDAKFHISVHGQTSCQDCHETIADGGLHPNPANVSKELTDFFGIEQCLTCHDEILEDLDNGVHGSEQVESRQAYEDCLECHDPHYQLSLSEDASGQFDPDKPIYTQCGACHDPQKSLPDLSSADEDCMTCHRDVDPKESKRRDRIFHLCFYCHGNRGTEMQAMTAKLSPLIDETEFKLTPHAGIECTSCHVQAAGFKHSTQSIEDCRQCHTRHDTKKAHDVHISVTCQACHLEGILPIRDPESKTVAWEKTRSGAKTSQIHQMARAEDETFCRRCHFRGNNLGAVSMILPPKSVLCMPCHAATLSAGDLTTVSALVIFLIGLIMTVSIWFSGSLFSEKTAKASILFSNAARAIFCGKLFSAIKAVFFDVFLQRRLYRRSPKRWIIHGLIFFPFVFRFVWGIVGLFASIWLPDRPLAWSLLDKNNPAAAFLFDLTGMMILLGVIFAFLRERASRADRPAGLPAQDRWALGLIGGIVGIGFILEAMRIAMTGWPAGSAYAVIGYAISHLFSGMTALVDVYGYVWYIHAVLTGAFMAYLPFSRLMHIIIAPLVLTINAASDHEPRRL
jgi:nitrate reductase gamma subunit